MRLLVVSHTPHYLRDGEVVGWGPTVRELDQLASRFTQVRHVACLHDEPAPSSALPYQAGNIELVPVRAAGADGLRGKLDALGAVPSYARTIARELADADVVHVRAPANIALVAMLLLATRKRPRARWFKYAGNWQPPGRDEPSYRLQRFLLASHRPGGIVTVNGAWPDQPAWVRAFDNPCLDDADLARGRAAALTKQLAAPIRILFVGQLTRWKGADRALAIIAELVRRKLDVRLDLVGDGPERAVFEAHARELGVAERVTFRGWLPSSEVHEAYAPAHLLLLPTNSEGWPKVLSEGMAYGVVPVTSAVSSIPYYIDKLGVGVALRPDDISGFADAIASYVADPQRWRAESQRAVTSASQFSYAHYLAAVDKLVDELVGAS